MTRFSTTRRIALVGLVFSLLLAACGDDSEPSTDAGSAPSDDGDTAPIDDDAGPEPSSDGAPAGEVGAVLVVGDEEFVLPERRSCISSENLGMDADFSDGPDLRVSIDLPPHDWETDTRSDWGPPDIGLVDWTSDGRRGFSAAPFVGERYPGAEPAKALVDEYQVGDGWATGSGYMIDTQALVDAEGDGSEPPSALPFTFEVVC